LIDGAYRARLLLIAALVAAWPLSLLADPGFGMRKRQMSLLVRRPALVRLANTTIGFKGVATDHEYQAVLGSLEATLETELVANERTLIKKPPEEAEWVLQVTVTGYGRPTNARRHKYSGTMSTTYVRWTGSLNVAYQVLDRHGRVHDADNVNHIYDREFNETTSNDTILNTIAQFGRSREAAPGTEEEVKQRLVKEVVLRIAANLGNTVQALDVRIAGGHERLNRAGDFLEERLWSRAIEELEKTLPFGRLQHEAFRQYALGLAYEALSYDSRSYEDQRTNLFKAQEFYDRAMEMNRDERYFVESVARTKESVARYRELDTMRKADTRRASPPPVSTPTPMPAPDQPSRAASDASDAPPAPPPPPAASARKALTAADIIKLHTAGTSAAQIQELIELSPAAYDCLDTDTVISLNQARVPVAVQNAMRKKCGLNPLPPAPQRRPFAGQPDLLREPVL